MTTELFLNHDFCDELIYTINKSKENLIHNGQALFNCLTIKDLKLKQRIEEKLNMSFLVLRLHEFKPNHYAENHTDTAYKRYSTAIIRLDNPCQQMMSRFTIDNKDIFESKGHGFLLPPETYHEVKTGYSSRFTLCGWALNPNLE